VRLGDIKKVVRAGLVLMGAHVPAEKRDKRGQRA